MPRLMSITIDSMCGNESSGYVDIMLTLYTQVYSYLVFFFFEKGKHWKKIFKQGETCMFTVAT